MKVPNLRTIYGYSVLVARGYVQQCVCGYTSDCRGGTDVAPGMADLTHKGIEVKPIKPDESTVVVAKAPAVGAISLVPASAVPGSDAPTGLHNRIRVYT